MIATMIPEKIIHFIVNDAEIFNPKAFILKAFNYS